MSNETAIPAENNNYHGIVVSGVPDDHAPAIVISGVFPWQDSCTISPAQARALMAELARQLTALEGVTP